MKTIRRTIYKGRDDPRPRISFRDRNDQPIDFSTVVRLVLTINPGGASPVTVDTNAEGMAVMPISGNSISFDIGELAQVIAMPDGEYFINLTAIDGAGDGSELLHALNERFRVIFAVRSTETIA